MIGNCKLNNKSMRTLRRDHVYQCVILDLAMMGVITKEQAESLLYGPFPKGLELPNAANAVKAAEEPKPEAPKPVVSAAQKKKNTSNTAKEAGND